MKLTNNGGKWTIESDSSVNVSRSTNNITVTDSNGKNYEIHFGSVNQYDSTLYYMMVKGDDNVYTVSSDLIEAFSKTVDDIEETTKATAKK